MLPKQLLVLRVRSIFFSDPAFAHHCRKKCKSFSCPNKLDKIGLGSLLCALWLHAQGLWFYSNRHSHGAAVLKHLTLWNIMLCLTATQMAKGGMLLQVVGLETFGL